MTLLTRAYRVATSICAPLVHWGATRSLNAAQKRERLGGSPNPTPDVIWFQAPSLGELRVLAPLLEPIRAKGKVLITTHSLTGYAEAQKIADVAALAPLDTPAATRRFLSNWRPQMAVFVESDTPPNMLAALAHAKVPRALIAARASQSRKRAPRSMAAILAQFDLVTAANPAVAEELEQMGIKVALSEDLKAQATAPAAAPDWAATLNRPIWLAASTHPEDESQIFDAHRALLADQPDTLLIIAPRHPRPNRDWVPSDMKAGFFSDGAVPQPDTSLYVIDAMGQLPSLHAATSVTYLGGATGTRGGHSPWEAAMAANHILTGPDISNNAAAFDQLEHHVVRNAQETRAAVQSAWATPQPKPTSPPQSTATLEALKALLAVAT